MTNMPIAKTLMEIAQAVATRTAAAGCRGPATMRGRGAPPLAPPLARALAIGMALALAASPAAVLADPGAPAPPSDLPPPAAPTEAAPDPAPAPETGSSEGSGEREAPPPGDAEGPVLDPPAPPPRALATQQPLTDWERSVLMRGPISEGSWILGGILGTWMGFGMGHLAQGRFGDSGVVFAGGEIGAIVLMAVAIPNAFEQQVRCNENGCFVQQNQRDMWQGVAIGAGVAFLALRIWEIYDVWAGPSQWNDAYRRARDRAGPGPLQFSFSVVPTQGGGSMFGQLRF